MEVIGGHCRPYIKIRMDFITYVSKLGSSKDLLVRTLCLCHTCGTCTLAQVPLPQPHTAYTAHTKALPNDS